jgi:hypothetical protein
VKTELSGHVKPLLLQVMILNKHSKQTPLQVEISFALFLCLSNYQNQVINT